MASPITVGVRVRPFNTREIKYQSTCIVDMQGNATLLHVVRQGKRVAEKPREFVFDYAFWTHEKSKDDNDTTGERRPFADQPRVYDAMGRHIVENAVTGYNACLFAYGQTGSGKTYSMMGTQSDPGILPRLGTHLFQILDQRKSSGLLVEVTCSFCEIYNDIVQDLLSDTPNKDGLHIRKHPKHGIFVQGLRSFVVNNQAEFTALLDHALSSRAVSSTKMNSTSSRSHAIVLMKVVQTDPRTGAVKTGKMSLVDLAGSERADSTGSVGDTLVEAQNINYSLSVLGMCLSRLADLAEGNDKMAHVPFRDSSLTFLLSENLGGNSKTSMLATISPADVNFEETLSTLRFASITKRVKTVAVINESENAKIIRQLREELAELKAKLQTLPPVAPRNVAAAPVHVDPAVVDEQAQQANEDSATAPEALDPDAETYEEAEHEDAHHDDAVPDDEDYSEEDEYRSDVEDDDGEPSNDAPTESPPPKPPKLGLGGGGLGGLKLNLSALSQPTDLDAAAATDHDDPDTHEADDGATRGENIDWRKPLLIRLGDSSGAAAALQIREGGNTFRFDDGAFCVVEYDALSRQTSIGGSSTFHNGMLVDEKVLLRHGDRVIVGGNVFRFSHGEGLSNAVDFEREPHDMEHLILLERFGRAALSEARAKDAMAILKAYLGPVLQQKASKDGFANSGSLDTGSIATPRGSHPVVGALLDDLAFFNQACFKLEGELAEDYPALAPPDKTALVDTTPELNAALEEQRRQQAAKEAMVQQLRDELTRAQSHPSNPIAKQPTDADATRESSPNLELEEAKLQDYFDEQCVERVLSHEVAWHNEVRTLRAFQSAPTVSEDLALWRKLSENAPFMSDPALAIIRTQEGLSVCDPQMNSNDFNTRCIALSTRFIYIFKKLDGRERMLTALYIPGCTTVLWRKDSKSTLLEIFPSCPRTSEDKSTSGAQAKLILQFKTEKEGKEWASWIERHSTPEQPISMLKRSYLQLLREQQSAGSGGVATVADVGAPFDPRQSWRHDSTVKSCANCKKDFSFFRRRHHCRECSAIFCADCLVKKKCEQCRKTSVTDRGRKDGGVAPPVRLRTVQMIPSGALYNGEVLQEYFIVLVGTFPCAAAYRADPDKAAEGTAVALLADLYRGRIHSYTGADFKRFRRCPRSPRTLLFWMADGTFITWVFQDGMARERALEFIVLLTGRRAFLPPQAGIELADESDVIVENRPNLLNPPDPDAATCLLKLSSNISSEARLWVGTDEGRIVLQQGAYHMMLLLSRGDVTPWDSSALATARLTVLVKAPFRKQHSQLCLYLLADTLWAQHYIDEYTVCTDETASCVAVFMQEASILFVASHSADTVDDEFLDVDDEGEISETALSPQFRRRIPGLQGIVPVVDPHIDPLAQFSAVFVLNHPSLAEFNATSAPIQYRAPDFAVTRLSPSHIEGILDVQLPVISTLIPVPPETIEFPKIGVAYLQLDSVSRHFADEFEEKQILTDFTVSATCPCSPVDVLPEGVVAALQLTNRYRGHDSTRYCIVHVPGLGAARVTLLQALDNSVKDFDVDLFDHAELSARGKIHFVTMS